VAEGHSGGEKLAAQFFFDAIFPFAVLVLVSLVTRAPPKHAVDSFFGKMKTPVGCTRELDDAALEETRLAPLRFNYTKLFPNSDWEFTKWDRSDASGFAVCCAVSASIIGLFWAALRAAR
jgi:hypothetical protein